MPLYINRIFLVDETVLEACSRSFQAVYRHPDGMAFVVIEMMTWLLIIVVSVCACGMGAILAVRVGTFYIQNAAYYKGLPA